jgi:hypothetical protein
MDQTRCSKCNKRLTSIADRNGGLNGRTELRCLKCDGVDPMNADAAKWSASPLKAPKKVA